MIAIQYRKSIPRYLTLRAIGPRWPGIYTSAVSPVSLCDVPEPPLPTPRWVRVRPTLTGICGSDLATVCAKGSPYLSPLISMPFVLGHELVGTISEVGAQAEGVSVGDRVVLQPALGCEVRGIEPMCEACATGHLALCRNVTRGDIAPGIQTGYCRDTGGSWSESFVAHPSQLYKVPDALDDELAVLAEPLACAIHAALRARVDQPSANPQSAIRNPQSDPNTLPFGSPLNVNSRSAHSAPRILLVGCGTIGLLTIAAIRALGPSAWGGTAPHITAIARDPHQREHARTLGADEVLPYMPDVNDRYRHLAETLDAELFRPELGKPTVIGGADITFDCVASATSIDDCLRFTTAGGTVVLVGMPAIPSGIDWTTMWYKELTVRTTYAYGEEQHEGRKTTTFDLALEALTKHASTLRPLVGSPFAMCDYRDALRTALNTDTSASVKTVFRIRPDA